MSLPSGWCNSSLEEIIDILDSRRVPINSEERARRNGNIPYYGATGQVGWINDFLFDEELVLLGEDGAPFLDATKPKAYIIRGKSWVNNHAHVLRGCAGVSNAFVAHQLNTVDFHRFVSGSTRLKLPQAPMRAIPLVLAPTEEQLRIVDEIEKQFTRLDDAMAALKRVQANLKRYRASVLKAACEGRLLPTEAELARKEGRDYEPASELLKRILAERRAKWEADQLAKMIAAGKPPKDNEWKKKYKEPEPPDTSKLPELPEGWVWARLGQLIREPLRNGHSAKESQNGSGVRTLTLTAVTNGDFSEANVKLTVADPNRVRDLWLESGDIYIERSNTPELVGLARLFRGAPGFAIFPDLLIRIRVSTLVDARYVESHLLCERTRSYLRGSAQGISGSMPKIDQGVIENTLIALPPQSEQVRIAESLEKQLSYDAHLESVVRDRIRDTARLRASVLTSAFSAKLVPQDPNDEPASALLERIRAERTQAAASKPERKAKTKRERAIAVEA